MRDTVSYSLATHYGRVYDLFADVRRFCSAKLRRLAGVKFVAFCQEIQKLRLRESHELEGRRAFMHTNHHGDDICTWMPAASELTDGYLVGIFLHEFGHVATHKGDAAADRWVLKRAGIPILYRGPLALEWVPKDVVRRISRS